MIRKENIEKMFEAQLGKIKDNRLKDQVAATWVKGCEQGRWKTMAELKKMPFTLLTDAKGVSFIEHTVVVTETAYEMARIQQAVYKKMPYRLNMDYLIAGGLLHDVGKLVEIEKNGQGGYRKSLEGKYARHPISGAILAAEAGLPGEIINIIACHAKEGEGRPQRTETVLIHLADFSTFDPLVMLQKGLLIH